MRIGAATVPLSAWMQSSRRGRIRTADRPRGQHHHCSTRGTGAAGAAQLKPQAVSSSRTTNTTSITPATYFCSSLRLHAKYHELSESSNTDGLGICPPLPAADHVVAMGAGCLLRCVGGVGVRKRRCATTPVSANEGARCGLSERSRPTGRNGRVRVRAVRAGTPPPPAGAAWTCASDWRRTGIARLAILASRTPAAVPSDSRARLRLVPLCVELCIGKGFPREGLSEAAITRKRERQCKGKL